MARYPTHFPTGFAGMNPQHRAQAAPAPATPPTLPVPGGADSIAAQEWFFSLLFASGGAALPKTLPLPARMLRNDYLKHWDAFFAGHPRQARWQGVRCGKDFFRGLMLLTAQVVKDAGRLAATKGVQDTDPFFKGQFLAWCGLTNLAPVYHLMRKGETLVPTEILDSWLRHSDVGLGLPATLFRLPVPNLYLPLNQRGIDGPFEGVYCFEGTAPIGCRTIDVVFMTKTWTRAQGRNGLLVQVSFQDEQAPLEAAIDEGIAQVEVDEYSEEMVREYVTAAKAHLDYMVKLFLYMSLPEARKVPCREWSEHQAKLSRLGPRKATKLLRKSMDTLHDRIEVGPTEWPESTPCEGEGHEVLPHWRRGHFRHQPCGPRNQERKLIFVRPVMVRADRFLEGSPSAMR